MLDLKDETTGDITGAQIDRRLTVGLETTIPETLAIGKGNAFYLAGYCFDAMQEIVGLEVEVGEITCPVIAHSVARQDIREKYSLTGDAGRRSYYSGFWAIVCIPERRDVAEVSVRLKASLGDGTRLTKHLARVRLLPSLSQSLPALPVPRPHSSDGPLATICMATYNPPPALLRRQIQSIIDQTHRNWICIVSDDASRPELRAELQKLIEGDSRFFLSVSTERLGFYRNFERSLSMAPPEADFVALSDQDDYWQPDKLSSLIARFDEKTSLVYSDMRIVTDSGKLISETYWTTRKNNYSDLSSLMLANTVTGAASMFRRNLLDFILPFPHQVGTIYHDHWIASVALVLGEVKYIDRALYDYTQHDSNVIGHYARLRDPLWSVMTETFKRMLTSYGRVHAREIYRADVLRIEAMARVAAMRCDRVMKGSKERALRRMADLDGSFSAMLWLLLRGFKDWRRISVTIGSEYDIFLGVFWKHYINLKSNLVPRSRK
jgi:glycosyltransferase involved in cell wall biosynthesis